MISAADPLPSPFTAAERDLIRREMGLHFGQLPSLADGLLLRTWRGGPQKGGPKIRRGMPTWAARDVARRKGLDPGDHSAHRNHQDLLQTMQNFAAASRSKTEVIDPWLRAMSSVSCHAILWGGATGELLIASGEEIRQVFLCRLASPAW